MKKYKILTVLLLIIISIFMFSCSDDDDDIQAEQTDQEEEIIRDHMRTNLIFDALCKTDTLESGVVQYSSCIGRRLYDVTPTVYYTIANNVEEAETYFQNIISVLNNDNTQTLELRDITQGDIHLTFSESRADGEVARIAIDCLRLKDVVTEIVFLTEERWPNNDNSSPFRFLSVWKYQNCYYICVRDCRCDKGIMLTFDGGWIEDSFTQYDHWQGQFSLYKNTASGEAFDALARAMNNNKTRMQGIINRLYWGELEYKNTVLFHLFEGESYFFDNGYTYGHHVWWAYNCYDVTIQRTKFKTKFNNSVGIRETEHFSSHYTHKDRPERCDPSHEIRFDYDFSKAGWEEIYKGI